MPNSGIPFDRNFIDRIVENETEIDFRVIQLEVDAGKQEFAKSDILAAISYIDLTTLNANDTPRRVSELLDKAQSPLAGSNVNVAAVCIYQPFVAQAVAALKHTEINIATVAGGFPAGQMMLDVKCVDIANSVQMGATEIDVVINRANPLTENWQALYDEVRYCKAACGPAKLKIIIATGDLLDYTIIAKTSWVCMMAGADFIKTSTGLEKVNATLEAGFVMMKAIRNYHKETGKLVGFKPAGGIRTTSQAMRWLHLLNEELGEKWEYKALFRIGASGLLDDLVLEYSKL